MERASKQRVTSLLAAAAAGALAVPQSTQAGTSTWTGGGTTTAATLNTGNPSQVSVNYLTWDAVDAANWGGVTPYAIGDTAVFNAASGTFVIRPAANTLDPASMTFDGGATYDFLRASTTAGSGSSWAQNNTAGLFGADSFGSPAPYGAANNTSFSTASTFTGTVSEVSVCSAAKLVVMTR